MVWLLLSSRFELLPGKVSLEKSHVAHPGIREEKRQVLAECAARRNLGNPSCRCFFLNEQKPGHQSLLWTLQLPEFAQMLMSVIWNSAQNNQCGFKKALIMAGTKIRNNQSRCRLGQSGSSQASHTDDVTAGSCPTGSVVWRSLNAERNTSQEHVSGPRHCPAGV